MQRVVITVLVVVLLSVRAAAQPAQLVEQRWDEAVQELATALVEGDPAALDTLLDGAASIRSFSSERQEDSLRLLARAHRATVISARAHAHQPVDLADQLAEDFAASDLVPDSLTRRMTLSDDAERVRANEIARRWVAEVLDPAEGQRVGVIVLWPGVQNTTEFTPLDSTAPQVPIFILARAERNYAGELRITRIVHGDPQARGN